MSRKLVGFQTWAKENKEPLQLTFAAADVVRLAQQGLGDLLRRVGRQFIAAVMEPEVEQLVGLRSQPNPERQGSVGNRRRILDHR